MNTTRDRTQIWEAARVLAVRDRGISHPLGAAIAAAAATAVLASAAAGSAHHIGARAIAASPVAGYSPAQIQAAYDLGPLLAAGNNGAGETIGIVDSFGSPTIARDLAYFDATFGLPPPPSLKIVAPAGKIPRFDVNNSDMAGWAMETTLDVEWAHAMAPGAKILLIETPVSETEGVTGFPQIVKAENSVINSHSVDVISQSFGATEPTFPNRRAILGLRSAFVNAARNGVTVLAASGDYGSTDARKDGSCCYSHQVNSWPSSDPLVTSVGGTDLHLDASGKRATPDTGWSGSGGGHSAVFGRPSYQDGVSGIVGAHRSTPDISMSASPWDGAAVYETFDGQGWTVIGGTSWATPLFSGIVAIADQMAGHDLGRINPTLYRLASLPNSGIVDVMSGYNGTGRVPGFNAGPGYDLVTGLGSVDAALLAPNLANPPAAPAVERALG